ncbi:hypothetical protein [Bacillus sp. 1P06AnD]|uniref:hypothetical protein n=1 Tax=Bacillus sp. 1P06AnD TaxID=3132208 RepID=UPI0039A1706B
MKKTIGVLHAHHSNIPYIERIINPHTTNALHFVDPGLLHRISQSEMFPDHTAQHRVKGQLEWISSCHVDAILITCTNYIACLDELSIAFNIPLLKIDEPLFQFLCSHQERHTLFFTNPKTVPGTMKRLQEYSQLLDTPVNTQVDIIEGAFDLLMKGRKQEHDQRVSSYIIEKSRKEGSYAVCQLSMVDAAEQAEHRISSPIIQPLRLLKEAIACI